MTVLESSSTSVKSSTVWDEDSETRSEGQTFEVVEEEGGSGPTKQLFQWEKFTGSQEGSKLGV